MPFYQVAAHAVLFCLTVSFISYLKEGGRVRDFGPFMFSFVKDKPMNIGSLFFIAFVAISVLNHLGLK